MAKLKMQTIQECPVRNGPSVHGKVLKGALIGSGQLLVVADGELDSPHDGWVRVIGPNPPIGVDGTYLNYGEQCWVEYAHLKPAGSGMKGSRIVIDIDWDNKTWTAKAE